MIRNWCKRDKQIMKLISILGAISFLCLTTTLAQEISWSKPGCKDKCGNVIIAYPFGIGTGCSANSSFAITCNTTTTPAKPFLSSINSEVLNISVHGVIIVTQPVSPMSCSGQDTTETLPFSLTGTPFTISPLYNSLVVLGCTNSVWLFANETTRVAGCVAICETGNSTDNRCSGLNCCKATIPAGLQRFRYGYRSIESSNESSCGYALPVENAWLQRDYRGYTGLHVNQSYPYDQEFVSAPLVLEWELDNPLLHNPEIDPFMCRDADEYRNPSSENTDPSTSISFLYYRRNISYVSSTKYCSCGNIGSQGNPYLPGGCIDIDECASNSTNPCRGGMICINAESGFACMPPPTTPTSKSKANTAFISVGSAVGGVIFLIVVWMSAKAIRKRIKAKRRHQFFKRNGGLLLQQQLSSTDNSLEKAKLFTYKELARATDHYNENRILGRGGQGTVYKGMLTDGRILAIKKSRKVEEGDLEVFINEVLILSQVNHRNVVKLLGCCLESEVPLLVYEFVPNGTLFQHIHEPSEEFPLTWEMRVRIAREVAGALAYLHSAASAPIYHRDIKSTNILLDEKYRAKVSDFGASRSIGIDQTHLTTRVLGTFGYLDPEYFQSSQFTEKSDVYSFGVVMVELLTGEKAVSSINRAEGGRSLATHFLDSMEEDQLFDILDERVLREGKKEEIVEMAQLARRCLNLNGKRRPTMKEVAMGLEGIQMKEGSRIQQNQDYSKDSHAVEVDETYDFSSIRGSMHFDDNSQHDHHRLLD